MRSTLESCLGRVTLEQGCGRGGCAGCSHGVDGGGGEVGMLGQELPGFLLPGRAVLAVGQAGQPQELVDQGARAVARGRLPVG